jgi:hypothetical protein
MRGDNLPLAVFPSFGARQPIVNCWMSGLPGWSVQHTASRRSKLVTNNNLIFTCWATRRKMTAWGLGELKSGGLTTHHFWNKPLVGRL